MPQSKHRIPTALALVAVLCLGAACSRGEQNPSGGLKTITSSDGALQFQVPSGWSQDDDLNEVAALEAGDSDTEAYGVVIADRRSLYASMDLAKFADQQVQELAKGVGLANLKGPERVTVDGKDALQYELKGFRNAVEVVYLYTFVETPDRFLKVITWSLASNFDSNRRVLEQVTGSIRELKPLEEEAGPATQAPPAPEDPAQPDPAQVPTLQDPGGIDRGAGPET